MLNLFSRVLHALAAAFYMFIAIYSGITLAELPVKSSDFSTDGTTYNTNGNVGTINQVGNSSVLNWNSFNVGSGNTVNFNQPNVNAIAINKIRDLSPSQIHGAINANGKIYLLNSNGFVFGSTSRVNVNGLVASALDIDPDSLAQGINDSSIDNQADFIPYLNANGEEIVGGEILIQEGAQLNGKEVFLFAPSKVHNMGDIQTTDGQTILAAGKKIYLGTNSGDERNLLVEVDAGGTVINGAEGDAAEFKNEDSASMENIVGRIFADRGVVTLLGMSVKQNGGISATTSVEVGGKVRLLSRDNVTNTISDDAFNFSTQNSGDLSLGKNSITQILPDIADATDITNATPQPQSEVELYGKTITLDENSKVIAPSGKVTITAKVGSATQLSGNNNVTSNEDVQVEIKDNALVDVSGLENVAVDFEKNLLEINLLSDELKDNVLIRDNTELRDILRNQKVVIDVRNIVEFEGETFEGTALADISGFIDAIGRTVAERSTVGGDIDIQSQGGIDFGLNAKLDVSGGSIVYNEGIANTTRFEKLNGDIVDISQALPNINYKGIAETSNIDRTVESYIEGKSAGSVSLNGKTITSVQPLNSSNLVANTVKGRFQTRTNLPSNLIRSNRPSAYNYAPRGGTLNIGDVSDLARDFTLEDLRINNIKVTSSNVADSNSLFLSDSLFNSNFGNFSQTSLAANNQINIDQSAKIVLNDGGSIRLASQNVTIDGDISMPSGSIDIQQAQTRDNESVIDSVRQVLISSSADINLSGKVIDRNAARNIAQQETSSIDGGSLDVEVGENANLTIQSGANVDVSAGVEFGFSEGTEKLGSAGSVSLNAANSGATSTIALENTFKGYGVQGLNGASQGGSFKIESNDNICLGSGNCAFNELNRAPTTLNVSQNFIGNSGFSDFDFTSQIGEAKVDRKIFINPLVRELRPSSFYPNFVSRVTNPFVLQNGGASFKLTSALQLSIDKGAGIIADNLSTIDLFSDKTMFIGGELISHGGDIRLGLGNGSNLRSGSSDAGNTDQYDPTHAIWLGEQALLDVSGTLISFVNTVNGEQLELGRVLDAGTIELDAERGYIVTESGSRLKANGVSGLISTPYFRNTEEYTTTQVSGAAGTVSLTAAEQMFLEGSINLNAGSNSVSGGTLNVTIDATDRRGTASLNTFVPGFKQNFSQIKLSNDSGISLQELAALNAQPEVLFGDLSLDDGNEVSSVTTLTSQLILESGASNLNLSVEDNQFAPNPQDTNSFLLRQGQILFDDGLDLALNGAVSLDASEYLLPANLGDVTAKINAHIISFGSSNIASNRIFPTFNQSLLTDDSAGLFDISQTSNNTTLTFNADLIELFGDTVVNNVKNFVLSSSGDIRARGIKIASSADAERNQLSGVLAGSLNMRDANLVLSAQQIYPTTYSDYRINNTGVSSSITTNRRAGNASDAYSIGGELTLKSRNIQHNGVLKAPVGTIRLQSDVQGLGNITLADGSLLSLSLEGNVLPFGEVILSENEGGNWFYRLTNEFQGAATDSFVFNNQQNIDLIPQASFELDAVTVDVQAGSEINIDANGTLLGTQFTPGLDGSVDVLATEAGVNKFAIIANSDLQFGITDPSLQNALDSAFGAGLAETFILETSVNGLSAGTYVKLPSEYAILPNAYLVTEVGTLSGIRAGDAVTYPDDSILAAGFNGLSNGLASRRELTTFKIESRAVIDRQANYQTFSFGDFAEQVIRPSTSTPFRTPNDAGVGRILSKNLQIQGDIFGRSAVGGRGGALDFSADKIAVVKDGFDSVGTEFADSLLLFESQLNTLQVESVLLGGVRIANEDNSIGIDVSASNVEVLEDVNVILDEFIAVATKELIINDNAIIASGDSALKRKDTLQAPNDGALLLVSGVSDWSLTPSSEDIVIPQEGTLVKAGANTELIGGGSVIVSTTNDFQIDETTKIQSSLGTATISAPTISISQEVGAGANNQLSANTVSQLDSKTLVLNSSDQLGLSGDFTINRNNLDITASKIVAEAENTNVVFNIAEDLVLTGTNLQEADSITTGTSSLAFNAGEKIQFNGGELLINNFSTASLSSESIQINSDGSLDTSGDLRVTTKAVNAGIGNDFAFNSLNGGISFDDLASDLAVQDTLSLGSKIILSAVNDVLLNTKFALNSGVLDVVSSQGQVTLGSKAEVDLSGLALLFNDQVEYTEGGSLTIEAGTNIDIQAVANADQITIDLRGADLQADSGGLTLRSPNGQITLDGRVEAGSGAEYNGGRFNADMQQFSDDGFSGLISKLADSGFTHEQVIRVREGDITLAENETINSETIELTADTGAISIAGKLDASSNEEGYIGLYAQSDLTLLNTAQLDTKLINDDEFSQSEVFLSTREGQLDLQADSRINLSRVEFDSNGLETVTGNGGRLYLKAPRIADNEIAIQQVASNIEGATEVIAEAYTQTQSESIDDALIASIKADLDAFSGNLTAIQNRLGANGVQVKVIPGVEVLSNQDLTIASNWDLHEWRFGDDNVAPHISLLAQNNLLVNARISDGFESALSDVLLTDTESSSYTVVAGADLSSANTKQTLSLSELAEDAGDVIIAPGTLEQEGAVTYLRIVSFVPFVFETVVYDPPTFDENLTLLQNCNAAGLTACEQGPSTQLSRPGFRTGTGDIGIYAARDLTFGNDLSNVYTAGLDSQEITLFGLNNLAFPEQGGDIAIKTGRDIQGATISVTNDPTRHYVNDYIHKSDKFIVSDAGNNPLEGLGWTVDFSRFSDEVGALAGGNIDVNTGGAISDTDFIIASIGKQIGGVVRDLTSSSNQNSDGSAKKVRATAIVNNQESVLETFDGSEVEIVGGGNLNVYSEGDITGTNIFVGKGRADVETLGSFGNIDQGAIISLGDAEIDINSRKDTYIDNIYNFSFAPTSSLQPLLSSLAGSDNSNTLFITYTDDTRITAKSLAGTLTYTNNISGIVETLTGDAESTDIPVDTSFSLLPGTVEFAAISGDVVIGNEAAGDLPFILMPSPIGNLDIIAGKDIFINNLVYQSDVDAALLPNINNTISNLNVDASTGLLSDTRSVEVLLSLTSGEADLSQDQRSSTPTALQELSDGRVNNRNSRIVSREGSLIFTGRGSDRIFSAEAIDIFAGKDIINPFVTIQNNANYDISTIVAGNSIISELSLNDFGRFDTTLQNSGIFLDGPGRLDVVAGNDIELGVSSGIQGRGNLVNQFLSNESSAINVIAGFTDFDVRVNQFTQAYFDDGSYDTFALDYLALLANSAIANYGELIADKTNLSEYELLITQNTDKLLTPFVGLSAQDLQVLDLLGSGQTVSQELVRQTFLNLSTKQKFGTVIDAFNNEIFLSGESASLATQIGLGAAGLYAGFQRSFDAIKVLFPEHSQALNILQNEVAGPNGLVGVDTQNPNLVNFVSNLQLELAKLSTSQRTNVINQIQDNLADNEDLADAINQPLANAGITLQLTSDVLNIVESANDIDGEQTAAFVQTIQAQNDELFIEDEANISTFFSSIGQRDSGGINILAPFGFYNVGLSIPAEDLGVTKSPDQLGVIVADGPARAFLSGDLLVNESRVVNSGPSELNLYSLFDNLDAGRGSRTAIAASIPNYRFGLDGSIFIDFAPAFDGSGVRNERDRDGQSSSPGLFTPYGIVNAGDAGISSDNPIFIAALSVQNSQNIGGDGGSTAPVAPPPPTVNADASSAATNSANDSSKDSLEDEEEESLSSDAAAFLNVFVLGVGDGLPKESSDDQGADSASLLDVDVLPATENEVEEELEANNLTHLCTEDNPEKASECVSSL